MRRRRVNETIKEPISQVGSDIAHALSQQNLPIEQVIYLNEGEHVDGTNKYYINYPETWRTIANQNLILGVRSIRRRSYKRDIKINFDIQMKGYYNSKYTFIYSDSFAPGDLTKDNLLQSINEKWKTFAESTYSWIHVEYFKHVPTWSFVNDNILQLKVVESFESMDQWTMNIKVDDPKDDFARALIKCDYTEVVNTSMSESLFSLDERTYRTPLITFKNIFSGTVDEYLLAASFVSQTNHYYLGFTNTTFVPPKYYNIPRGESQFCIETYTPDGLSMAEIPNDDKDLVVIEIMLMTAKINDKIV